MAVADRELGPEGVGVVGKVGGEADRWGRVGWGVRRGGRRGWHLDEAIDHSLDFAEARAVVAIHTTWICSLSFASPREREGERGITRLDDRCGTLYRRERAREWRDAFSERNDQWPSRSGERMESM